MAGNYPSYEEIREVNHHLQEMRKAYWLHHDLFSFQWWLLLLALILPWILWWKFVDRKRIDHILLFGSLLMVVIILLDDMGMELHLWSYPYQLIQIISRLIAVDQGIIVVAHMFLYQYFPSWKKFLLANIIMAAIFTFIFEPLTVWLGIYKLENWHYIYSLPIYVLKASLIKWLVDHVILKREYLNRTS